MRKRQSRTTPKHGVGVPHEVGTSNVYVDLGYPNADDMLVKAKLASKISEIIDARGYTQTEAAEKLAMPQPKVSKLVRGQFRGISERKLMDCLNRLGHDVQIVVRARARAGKPGLLTVEFA